MPTCFPGSPLESLPGEWTIGVPIEIVEVVGEGRTLKVCKAVPAGKELWRERVPAAAPTKELLEVQLLAGLKKDGPETYWPAGPSGTPEQVRADKALAREWDFRNLAAGLVGSSYQLGQHVLLRVTAVLNHACAGSSEANTCIAWCGGCHKPNRLDSVVPVIASRDIAEGELLRVSYSRFFDQQHWDEISAGHGFVCRCSACSDEPEFRRRLSEVIEGACTAPRCLQLQAALRCSRCKAPYCSAECQRRDHPTHKVQCVAAGTAAGSETREAYVARMNQRVDALETMQCDPELEHRMRTARSQRDALCMEADHFRAIVSRALELEAELTSGSRRVGDHHATLYRARRRMGFCALRTLIAEKEAAEAAAEAADGPSKCRSADLARATFASVWAAMAVTAACLPRFDPEVCDLWRILQQLLELVPTAYLPPGAVREFKAWEGKSGDVLSAFLRPQRGL